jgi:hypothetical protein
MYARSTLVPVHLPLCDRGQRLLPTTFRLTPPQCVQIADYGLSYLEKITILLGASGLRVILRDGESGKVGSVKVPLPRSFPPAKSSAAKS